MDDWGEEGGEGIREEEEEEEKGGKKRREEKAEGGEGRGRKEVR